jgi:succinate dehydrogenase hydrophobic anchor subunit
MKKGQSDLSKFLAQTVSGIIMVYIALILIQELSAQSELIKSFSFLFYISIFAIFVTLIVKLVDLFR